MNPFRLTVPGRCGPTELIFPVVAVVTIQPCGADTTCAVLTADQAEFLEASLMPQIERRLAELPGVAILNRTDVKKLLTEHAIAIANSPAAHESGKSWGRILRADLLVILTVQSRAEGRVVDVVLLETAHGLSLARDMFEWDVQVDRMAELIAGRVQQAVERMRGGLRHVFCVPPFESADLIDDFAYLKQAYRHVVEAAIRALPGAVIVELDHADQVARELALSAGPTGVQREAALHVRGRYRHRGRGADRRVDLEIELHEPGVKVSVEQAVDLLPEQAAQVVRQSVLKMAAEALQAPAAGVDGRPLEAELLEERSRAFRLAGDWTAAIDLAEAAVLMAPERAENHLRIFDACGRRLGVVRAERSRAEQRHHQAGLPLEAFVPPVARRQCLSYVLLGLEHLERYLHRENVTQTARTLMSGFWGYAQPETYGYDWSLDPERVRELQQQANRMQVEVILFVLEQDRVGDRHNLHELSQLAADAAQYQRKLSSLDTYLHTVERLLAALGNYDAFNEQCLLVARTLPVAREDGSAFDAFLRNLESSPDRTTRLLPRFARVILGITQADDGPAAQSALDALVEEAFPGKQVGAAQRSSIDLALYSCLKRVGGAVSHGGPGARPTSARMPDPSAGVPSAPVEAANEGTRFSAIKLQAGDGEYDCQKFAFGGWVATSAPLDVIWNHREVYSMTSPGRMDAVQPADGHRWPGVCDVQWDGRYFWIGCQEEIGRVHLLDSSTLRVVAEFDECDGLPPTTHGCRVAPIAPGTALAVGAFGRTWIAKLSYDAAAPAWESEQVDILHEARRLPSDMEDSWKQSRDVELAFEPTFAVTVQADVRPIVLIGRQWRHSMGFATPMIVDPAAGHVRLVDKWPFAARPKPAGDRVYLVHSILDATQVRPEVRLELDSAEPPDFFYHAIGSLTRPSITGREGIRDLYVDGNYVHVADGAWTTFDLKAYRAIRSVPLPGQHAFGIVKSGVLGMVLYGSDGVWQVSFDDPANPVPPSTSKGP